MLLPNMLICGAQKSGTTSLHRMLETHPDIFFPPSKQEIHFFDYDENYARGIEWYAAHFTEWSGQKIIAQTSPEYLFYPDVPGRIWAQESMREARLLFILRNPVDRAYSHYWHSVKKGYESLSFDEAIQAERGRMSRGGVALSRFSYLERGKYASHLRRFLDFFPGEQILAVKFEDLAGDQSDLYQRCAAFLGVEVRPLPPESNGAFALNKAKVPRSVTFQRLRFLLPWKRRIPFISRWTDSFNLKREGYEPMEPAVRARLARVFSEDMSDLEGLTGLDLREWR